MQGVLRFWPRVDITPPGGRRQQTLYPHSAIVSRFSLLTPIIIKGYRAARARVESPVLLYNTPAMLVRLPVLSQRLQTPLARTCL
jgi:hypothetical protein